MTLDILKNWIINNLLSLFSLAISLLTLWLNGTRVKKQKEAEFLLGWHQTLSKDFEILYKELNNLLEYLEKHIPFYGDGEIDKIETNKINIMWDNIFVSTSVIYRFIKKIGKDKEKVVKSIDIVRDIVDEIQMLFSNSLFLKKGTSKKIVKLYEELRQAKADLYIEITRELNILMADAFILTTRCRTIKRYDVINWENHD